MVLSPQRVALNAGTVAEHELPFELLHDPGNEVAALFGVRVEIPDAAREAQRSVGLDLPAFNGDDSWTLPYPSRFVIDHDGIIRDAVALEDPSLRVDPKETLAVIRRILE